jgi:glycosyltransferase involved in cell wall biosynthesis
MKNVQTDKTLITVIIPVYNTAKYLGECLDSVLGQTLRDSEIICVDDGSTDGSFKILKEYQSRDKRIKIIKQENRGPAVARNRAMKMAKGKYLAFIDSDDWYPDENCLEKLYNAAEQHKVKIAAGSFSEYNMKTKTVRTVYDDNPHLSGYTFNKAGIIEYKNWQQDFGWIRCIYNRQLIINNKIEFPNLRRHEDPVFFVKAMLAAEKFYAIPDIVYRYRLFHKPVEVKAEELVDAVIGIADNLKIAKENDLDILTKWSLESLWWLYSISQHSHNLEKELELAREELKQLRGKVSTLQNDIIKLKKSETYKVGVVVTWLPRKIKNIAKK